MNRCLKRTPRTAREMPSHPRQNSPTEHIQLPATIPQHSPNLHDQPTHGGPNSPTSRARTRSSRRSMPSREPQWTRTRTRSLQSRTNKGTRSWKPYVSEPRKSTHTWQSSGRQQANNFPFARSSPSSTSTTTNSSPSKKCASPSGHWASASRARS
jgi:hypothetical protein